MNSDSDKLPGKTYGHLTGWAEPIAGLGWAVLRGGGLFDGSEDGGDRRSGVSKVMKEQTAKNIIEEIIEKIINKDGVGGTDEEVTCEELLDQPGEGWKEVADKVLNPQDGGNKDVRIFSCLNKNLAFIDITFYEDSCRVFL